ncbi:hypothetical protein, partial [Pasteurella multocida]|uniref:hypothetical protein n=1 Tax=Pasteurella multocida TaxID=747 RepID=UPI0016B024F5
GAVAVFLSQCFIMLNHLTLDFGQSIILNKFKTAHFSGHHHYILYWPTPYYFIFLIWLGR